MQSPTAFTTLTMVTIFFAGFTTQRAAAQATAEVGDCDPPNVQVRGKVSMRNKTGQAANDFHFYMYQNDRPNVVVTGAQVSAAGCTGASVALDTDDGSGNPPPGNHGAHVDVDGCNIPPGEAVTVEIALCMNERNVVKIKDAEFTYDGDPLPHPKPPPNGGWRVGRPYRGGDGGDRGPGGGGRGAQEGDGGSGNWIHIVCIENDDSRWVIVDELKLLASTTFYPTLDSINWAAIDPIVDANGRPPVCIPPGGRYCYPFNTTGSYLHGHVYLKYKVRVADPGECAGGPLLDGIDNTDDEEDDDTVDMFGDHPVDALLTEVLEGLDYYVTAAPTVATFGGTLPPIPQDFFGPGSEPFTGTIPLRGIALNAAHSDADTVIQRLGEAYLPDDGSTDTVPIEMVALNLVSLAPLQVSFGTSTTQNGFDVLPGFNQTNNFSMPPTRTGVSSDGVSIDTEIIEMSLAGSSLPGMELRGQAADSGGPPGAFGVDSFFDIFFVPTPPVPAYPPGESSFIFTVNIQAPEGGHLLMAPPTLLAVDSFFDIFFEVQLPPSAGDGQVSHMLNASIPPDQPLRFVEVGLSPHTGQSFFDIFVVLEATGPVDPLQPLVRVTTQATSTFSIDSFFDVFYTLDPDFPAQGSMTLTRTSPEGGTFQTSLQILPRVTFVPVGGGPELVLPGITPHLEMIEPESGALWTYTPPAGAPPGAGPNFFLSSSPLQWVAPDGSQHTVHAASAAPPPAPVDFDNDTDVDGDDLQVLQACRTGPAIPYIPDNLPPGCTLVPDVNGIIAADLDADGDVDHDDFGGFQRCYGGSGQAPNPGCGTTLE